MGHAEEVAAIEFQNSDADRLRRALLGFCHQRGTPGWRRHARTSHKRRTVDAVRANRACGHPSGRLARRAPAPPTRTSSNGGTTSSPCIVRHGRYIRNLRRPSAPSGTIRSEQNFAWLRDVQGVFLRWTERKLRSRGSAPCRDVAVVACEGFPSQAATWASAGSRGASTSLLRAAKRTGLIDG